MKMRLAVIDDEKIVCKRLRQALEKDGYEVETFLSATPFLQRMAQHPYQLVFTDLRLPDMDGMALLKRVKDRQEDTEVVVITGYGSIDSAIEAVKSGACHYAVKPLKLEEVRSLARRILESIRLRTENRILRDALIGKDSPENIVGSSQAMQEVFALIKKVAVVDCNVLLQGRSGTGKELAAQAVHVLSPRRDSPFVSFNCGGFTEELISSELFGYEKGAFTGATVSKIGLFESAAKGTVFLDEIGEMPASMQVKLLHVMQEKRIFRVGSVKPIELDIRIVAATNRDLKEEVERGNFREDLFYRLNVVTLQLPSLRERRDDIPLLIAHFISKYNQAFGKQVSGIAPAALEILLCYDFPGNVRELKNIIERAVALAEREQIQVSDLPQDLQHFEFETFAEEGWDTLEEVEKRYIANVLRRTGHNRNLAARLLNLPRTTLWRRMRKYGLDR